MKRKKQGKNQDHSGTPKGSASSIKNDKKGGKAPASEVGDHYGTGRGLPSNQLVGSLSPTPIDDGDRRLTSEEFQGLSDVPSEAEGFNNIGNPRTRRAYKTDVSEFVRFVGIATPGEFRQVTRSHVIAWRKDLGSSPDFYLTLC